MAFDIRTVILVLAVGNLVIGLILLFFQFGTERTQRIPFLATGKLLQGVGWLLLYERGWLPDFVSFTLGNIVLIVGTAYDSWAMYWISQRPVSRARQVSSAVFVVAVCLIATPLSDAGRVAVTSFTVMIFFALGGRAMLSALDRRSLLRRHIGWSMWLMVAVISVRGLWATLAPEQFTLFSANTIQLVMFAILYYLMLTNSSGMLLLAKQSADRELRDSEARYRLLAENVGDVIWKMNPVTNRFTYVSPSVQKQRGYTAAEVLAEPVCAALTAESYAAASAALPERLAAFLAQNTGSATYTNELDQPCKDGSIIHTEVVTTYAHNEHGEVEVIGVSRDITARQRAEAALRESEAKYRFLTENIKDVIWTLDVETLRYLYVSPSVTPWLGYTPEEFMAEPFGATLDPQATRYVREILKARVAAFVASEAGPIAPSYLDEIEHLCKDGSPSWAEVVAVIRRNPTTGRLEVHGVSRDITARKRAEQELRQLSRAVEYSPVSIVITDLNGTIEYVNPKFTQTTGYTAAEALGHNPRILKSDHTPAQDYQHLWQTITAGGEWHGEFHNKKRNGDLYWEMATIAPVWNERGEITHFVAVKEDITARKHAEVALQRQRDFLTALHDTTLDLLNHRQMSDLLQAMVERAAVILDAPYGEIMLVEGEELVVHAFTANQAYLAGDRARHDEAILSWQAHDTGLPAILDDYAAWSAHRPLYDEVALRAVADFPIMIGQTCLGVLGLGRSQLDRPFTPEEIQQGCLFSQLAALVLDNANLYASALHELTERNLAEAALRESNGALQRRNEELDAYAHTVAHDLKNPLGVLVGYADLLLDNHGTLPDDIMHQSLIAISRSGRKAGNIIESLLVLASVRKQDVMVMPLDMVRLVDEVLFRLADSLRDSGADLHLSDRASWPIALGYAPWIEEIWVNYLSNAIKYGGPQPRIELAAQPESDGFIRFTVRDFGPGLTLDQQQRLFAPFERLGQARVKGHGLGLSVVRRITDKLGGQAGVDNAPGQGSTFYFTLPAAPANASVA